MGRSRHVLLAQVHLLIRSGDISSSLTNFGFYPLAWAALAIGASLSSHCSFRHSDEVCALPFGRDPEVRSPGENQGCRPCYHGCAASYRGTMSATEREPGHARPVLRSAHQPTGLVVDPINVRPYDTQRSVGDESDRCGLPAVGGHLVSAGSPIGVNWSFRTPGQVESTGVGEPTGGPPPP